MILLSFLYRLFYKLHHALCLRLGKPLQKSKLVIVGSYRFGGAGKTPVVIELAKRYIEQGKSIAILVHCVAFDEEILIKKKLPECYVVRTKNRYKTAHELDGKYDIVLCDDGFEDSRLRPDEKILLDWHDSCDKISDLWPCGKCRSLKKDHGNVTTVFDCSKEVFFFVESIVPLLNWFHDDFEQQKMPELASGLTVLCGLGDPDRFTRDVEAFLRTVSCQEAKIKTAFRPDHDRNFEKYAQEILDKNPGIRLIVSEKDACRFRNASFGNNRVFVAIQKVAL